MRRAHGTVTPPRSKVKARVALPQVDSRLVMMSPRRQRHGKGAGISNAWSARMPTSSLATSAAPRIDLHRAERAVAPTVVLARIYQWLLRCRHPWVLDQHLSPAHTTPLRGADCWCQPLAWLHQRLGPWRRCGVQRLLPHHHVPKRPRSKPTHYEREDVCCQTCVRFGLNCLCMRCTACWRLKNTSVCPLAQRADDTMVNT